MREDVSWIKELKVGDEVAVDESTQWYRNNYKLEKVEKITPTGRIRLTNGNQYYPDGRKVGESYSVSLKKITPEILEITKRRELIYKLKVESLVRVLPSDKLEILLQWQEEHMKEAK